MWPHIARWLMTLALGILVTPLAANAQLMGKVPRIGIVGNAYSERTWGVFRHVLHDLGYVEGQNLLLESRFTRGQYDQIRPFLAELIGLQVDVIVTGFTGATLAAREATSTIPIMGFPQFWNKKRRSVVSICATGTCMATHTVCDRTMATGPLS